jgi:hypothetical protein
LTVVKNRCESMSPSELPPALNAAAWEPLVAPSLVSPMLPATVHPLTVPTVSNGPVSKFPLLSGNVLGAGVAVGLGVGVGVGVGEGVGVAAGANTTGTNVTESTRVSAWVLSVPISVKRNVVAELLAVNMNRKWPNVTALASNVSASDGLTV